MMNSIKLADLKPSTSKNLHTFTSSDDNNDTCIN